VSRRGCGELPVSYPYVGQQLGQLAVDLLPPANCARRAQVLFQFEEAIVVKTRVLLVSLCVALLSGGTAWSQGHLGVDFRGGLTAPMGDFNDDPTNRSMGS